MSETYFDILPEDILPLVLINLPYEEGLYSLIKVLNIGDSIYRRLCTTIYPEMGKYPEEMTVKGLNVSWKELYHSVCEYSNKNKTFDKYEFYMQQIYGDYNILCLLLYDCLNHPSEEITLFTGNILKYEMESIKYYYLKYLEKIIVEIKSKKKLILNEKFKLMKRSRDDYTFIDENDIALVLTTLGNDGEVELVYHNSNWLDKTGKCTLTLTEMYKRGYTGPFS